MPTIIAIAVNPAKTIAVLLKRNITPRMTPSQMVSRQGKRSRIPRISNARKTAPMPMTVMSLLTIAASYESCG